MYQKVTQEKVVSVYNSGIIGESMAVNPNEEMKMTYTSVLTKDGKPYISLYFERGEDNCEASVPDCVITKNNGFNDEEIEALEYYLRANKQTIIDNSKNISGLFSILGK